MLNPREWIEKLYTGTAPEDLRGSGFYGTDLPKPEVGNEFILPFRLGTYNTLFDRLTMNIIILLVHPTIFLWGQKMLRSGEISTTSSLSSKQAKEY
jgi:hypothetical protein